MRTTASLVAPCGPDVLFDHVAELDRYPVWMTLVHTAVREPDPGDPDPGDPARDPAWSVELRTRVGPLARSKRLRMERTELEPGRLARFERRELDGRQHASWELTVRVEPHAGGSHLEMELSYGGALWTGGVLQRILDDEIRSGRDRLLELVTAEPTR